MASTPILPIAGSLEAKVWGHLVISAANRDH
jgi:hypothetical protein